ncbi:AAA family ATPase [Priestia aryabhattai]|uniref:AAA family ATPase n=1 Tax=Priestia aryabhattai TaxID=412384 RepID=UPI002E209D93|nr:AAA family ATPase [Priestia aryabhattai]MED4012944.1 AAA family ATPase [Priestia aryabhattai]
MKLIYLWVEKFRSIEKQEFSFDNEFDINYDNRIDSHELKIRIRKIENTLMLFGNHVVNVTAMIGENGSGKTNILDLLGYRMDNRFQHANQGAEYFMIYHLEGNHFVIEGKNINRLGIVGESAGGFANLFSIVVKLDEDGALKFVRFLQEKGEHNLATYVSIRQKFNRHNWFGTLFSLEEDPYYFFQRFAIDQNSTGIFNKYQFIKDAATFMEFQSTHNNLFEVSPDTFIEIKPNFNIDPENKLELKYKGSDFFDFLRFLQSTNIIEAKERKEHFIHSFLENSVRSLYQECVKRSEIDEDQLRDLINGVPFRRSRPKKYLLDVLKVLGEWWDPIIGLQLNFFDCYKQLYKFLSRLPDRCFQDKRLTIKVRDPENKHIVTFLQQLDEARIDTENPIGSLFSINIKPLSSGEEAYLNLFTSIYFASKAVSNVENKTCILLLDEPDSFMHPEWSRVMINQIINYLERTKGGYCDYQIILTTHSPFIISDLPKQNLIMLRKQQITGKSIKVKPNGLRETFASNIHTLLANEFFMKDTIGEFAKQKINWVITRLKEIISGAGFEESEKEQIGKWIEIIGEPMIKSNILKLYGLAFQLTPRQIREERAKRLRQLLAELEANNDDEGESID